VRRISRTSDRRIERQIGRALALQSSDPYLANRVWARIDRAVVDEAPVAPLYTLKQVDIASRRVGNFQYTRSGVSFSDSSGSGDGTRGVGG
jgi:peptide/nickel transport system substrate-binding protein